MHCTETAICAATGLPVEPVVSALERAVADAGAELDPEGAYKCEHWFAALEPLGFHGSVDPLEKGQPPVALRAFLEWNELPFILLLQCEKEIDGKRVGHLVATKGRRFVDTSTRGEIKEVEQMEDCVADYKVKNVVRLEEIT
jgi:hypothetical protein